MIWTILIVIIVLLISWVLMSPIRLVLDSKHHHYGVYWYGMASVRLVMKSEWPVLRSRILFWKKDWNFFSLNRKKKKKQKQTKEREFKLSPKKAWAFLNSFEIKKARLNLDTDDVILNSYLYPAFSLLSKPGKRLFINYKGDSEIYLLIENRLFRIIRTLLFT